MHGYQWSTRLLFQWRLSDHFTTVSGTSSLGFPAGSRSICEAKATNNIVKIFQDLWGQGAEPAEKYCYDNYNQLGTANGNCGEYKYKYGEETEFKKCPRR